MSSAIKTMTVLVGVLAMVGFALSGCSTQPSNLEYVEPVNSNTVLPSGSVSDDVTYIIEGYPLNLSVKEMTMMKDLQFVAELDSFSVGDAIWLTKDGKAPAYVLEGRPPTEQEAEDFSQIVTPVTARVVRNLWGDASEKSTIRLHILGGTVNGVSELAGEEIAPSIRDLVAANSVVVAGDIRTTNLGVVVDPWFAYERKADQLINPIGSDGASLGRGSSMSELLDLLHERACKEVPNTTALENRGPIKPVC